MAASAHSASAQAHATRSVDAGIVAAAMRTSAVWQRRTIAITPYGPDLKVRSPCIDGSCQAYSRAQPGTRHSKSVTRFHVDALQPASYRCRS